MNEELKEKFGQRFHTVPTHMFSAPGRTELGGNHTDHQRGRVLAAAVDLEIRAAAAKNSTGNIRVVSELFPVTFEVDLDDLSPRPSEKNTTAAMIRGVAAGFAGRGFELSGFDAYVISEVPIGRGMGSSAAFEVLMGRIMDGLFGCGVGDVEIAKIARRAENEYYGKPCGLMDMMASSVGGCIAIDFEDPADPRVTPVNFDFSGCGYAVCIIDTGSSHADLTAEYASVPAEMSAVSALFGKEALRDVPEEMIYDNLSFIRGCAGDRALLRAIHFYDENRRVAAQTEALGRGDIGEFLRLAELSGLSSQNLLQNVIPTGAKENQEMALALALARRLLNGRGACRVHGGGFAGTIQVFVPEDMAEDFCRSMEAVLGGNSCHILNIRSGGSAPDTL